jgi:4-hydroxy-3-polyprenylbenzoate decarboxylase
LAFKDLREYIALLEDKNDLRRITVPVSSDLEISQIADRVVKSDGPALLFENVEGYDMPLVINLFGSLRRIEWALGVNDLEDLGDQVRKLLGLLDGPPPGLVDKVKTIGQLMGINKAQPKIVSKAPCQEEIFVGDAVDLNTIPALKCWPMDAGRFITLPLVISRDPETGRRNVGTYRMQIYDSRTTGMHWQTHKVGARHFRSGEEKKLDRLDVAVALGGDPVTVWSGSLPVPPDMDEIVVSGIIRGESVQMVRCKTVDLEVPAHSEIILEGYVIPGEVGTEGPFGDHTGYYSPAADYPVFHVTAITRRKDAIYPSIVVGRPPSEDFFMGKASERLMLPALQLTLPEIIDVNMPAEGVFHNLLLVSIKKEYPGHARKVMSALWGLGLVMLAKAIIVLDHDVDVQNLSEVAWRVTANIDPSSDIVISEGPVDDLDHASKNYGYGSKMGLDATSKGKLDGRDRDWPDDITMDDEIIKLVEKRWDEYGI